MMSNVDIDVLLRDIDVFLNGYSSLNPTPSADDKPYRTVKTILYHLAKSLKSEVSHTHQTHPQHCLLKVVIL